jgi:hypothetical protein
VGCRRGVGGRKDAGASTFRLFQPNPFAVASQPGSIHLQKRISATETAVQIAWLAIAIGLVMLFSRIAHSQ